MATATPGTTGGPAHHEDIDWGAAARSPEFKELVRRKRSFVIPASIFFLCWYFGFIVLAGYAPGFMGESVYEGFTVGYLIALSQFVMVWVLAGLYLRRADRTFDPLARRVAERTPGAQGYTGGGDGGGGRRAPDGDGDGRGSGHRGGRRQEKEVRS
jgi:uncharacterized membrane protein (DUF485 family)